MPQSWPAIVCQGQGCAPSMCPMVSNEPARGVTRMLRLRPATGPTQAAPSGRGPEPRRCGISTMELSSCYRSRSFLRCGGSRAARKCSSRSVTDRLSATVNDIVHRAKRPSATSLPLATDQKAGVRVSPSAPTSYQVRDLTPRRGVPQISQTVRPGAANLGVHQASYECRTAKRATPQPRPVLQVLGRERWQATAPGGTLSSEPEPGPLLPHPKTALPEGSWL
jgi:hypothetical protein